MTGLTAFLLVCAGALAQQETALREAIRYSIEGSVVTEVGAGQAEEYGGVSGRSYHTDSRGRVYHANVHDMGTLLVFEPSGRFLTSVGRPGRGPGEFGMVWDVIVGKGDTLHVIDAVTRRRTILSPDYKHLRSDALPGSMYRAGLLSQGRLILNGRVATRSGIDRPFHIFNPATGSLRSFGDMRDPTGARLELPRYIAVGRGDVFWTTVGNSYLLQQWNDEGRLLKQFTRSVDWFPPANRRTPANGKTPPSPRMTGVTIDSSGLLWISTLVPKPDWQKHLRTYYDPNQRQQMYRTSDAAWDTIVEVVDPEAATIVASKRFTGRNVGFASANRIVFYRSDDLDRGNVAVWRLGLSNQKEARSP